MIAAGAAACAADVTAPAPRPPVTTPTGNARGYFFLPNGRFCYDGWRYGVALDAGEWAGEPRTDADSARRAVPMRHHQMWGKYRVLPAAAAGDPAERGQAELVLQDGGRRTLRAVSGRAYLRRVGSAITFENYRHFELRRARAGQTLGDR